MDAFRGTWYTDDGRSATIFDSVVRTSDGQSASITCQGLDRCVLEVEGSVVVGQLNADGDIKWDDGDLWMRSPVTPRSRRIAGAGAEKAQLEKSCVRDPIRPTTARDADISTLQEMFPSWDRQALADILMGADGSLESATSILLQWSGEDGVAKAQEAKPLHLTAAGFQKPVDPASPWQNAQILQLKPQPDISATPSVVARPRYDRIVAARLTHRYGGRQLAQLVKVATVWRRRAAANEGAGRSEGSGEGLVAREMAAEQRAKLLPSDAKVQEGKELLRQRCAFLGLRQVEMKDDGNCQFRAVSQELFGTQQHHATVRAEVVAHMRRQEAEYRSLFDEGEWRTYVAQMARDGEWGDELTLKAAADAFQVKIHVVTSTNNNWYLMYQPDKTDRKMGRELFLTYIAPIHYNALEPSG